VRFVDDKPHMGIDARFYEDGATGARSSLLSKCRQVPVLDRTLPDGTIVSVKFDGIDGRVLIDRKRSVTSFKKSKDQALRQSQALRENGMSGRWEVPNDAEASRARKMLSDLGISNIDVSVVP
jgi:filamentous hemagglutinin